MKTLKNGIKVKFLYPLPIQNLLVMDLIYKMEMISTQFRKE